MIDFDAFLKELHEKEPEAPAPTVFRIGGKDYPLPHDLPAVIALDIVRLKRVMDAKAEVDPSVLMEIGEGLFGRDAWREILVDNRIGVAGLGDLITQAFHAYGAISEEPAPNPEAPAGKTST